MFCCRPDFFQNEIFDFSCVLVFAVGPFYGIFVENVFFKISGVPINPAFCLCFAVARDFFKITIFEFSLVFALAVGLFCV